MFPIDANRMLHTFISAIPMNKITWTWLFPGPIISILLCLQEEAVQQPIYRKNRFLPPKEALSFTKLNQNSTPLPMELCPQAILEIQAKAENTSCKNMNIALSCFA